MSADIIRGFTVNQNFSLGYTLYMEYFHVGIFYPFRVCIIRK